MNKCAFEIIFFSERFVPFVLYTVVCSTHHVYFDNLTVWMGGWVTYGLGLFLHCAFSKNNFDNLTVWMAGVV